ncbi:MAG: 16S rRNA (adenine(1518)-N(6)/adenine(1519)-N(6))-dimethyltransferase RsmA [Rickettsiales bacterium]|jgi:16S rRNA (adenine1518-N6/adenine1519-N6)-dimethyltransferase|nr:16S rRNA (adenine(1518)-N(6)/adenine(1519)-N(6))-dimethyltransferase RsmA [Rickettsiales bacterium]
MFQAMAYDGLPPVARYIEKYGLGAKKSLGQNFICDLNVVDRIARAVPELAGSAIVEVGSGPAGLTRALLYNGARRVTAIEIDPRAIAILRELKDTFGDRLEIEEGDATKTDISRFGSARICANLPYNISIPLLTKWIFASDYIESMTLLFQKEVARRICAKPGSKEYGRISALAQLCYRPRILFDIAPSCFVPQPKVVSSATAFDRIAERPSLADLRAVEETTKIAFGQRRKMLRANFAERELAAAGIDPRARAEELSPWDFLALARGRARPRRG